MIDDINTSSRRHILRVAGAATAGAVAAMVGSDPHPALAATAASDVSVADPWGAYTATDVEGVLAELRSRYGFASSVAAFGAVGDGSTDDTSAVQHAIDSFPASVGGIVFFPSTPGQTYVVRTLYMADRVQLLGATRDLTLKKMPGSKGPVITHNLVEGFPAAIGTGFRNLTIDGNKANCPAATDGIGAHPGGVRTAYRGDFAIFDNVNVINCKRHGIYIGDASAETYLVMMKDVWSHSNDGRGVSLVKCYDCRFLTGWTAENVQGQYLLDGCANLSFIAPQIEGVSTGGTTYPGVEFVDTHGGNSAISFIGGTYTDHRAAFKLVGDLNDIRVTDGFLHKNSRNASGLNSDIEITPGAAVQTGILIKDNHFGPDAGAGNLDAVEYRVRVTVPAPGTSGALAGLSITGNAFRGTIGVNPTKGHVLVPTHDQITETVIEGNSNVHNLQQGCALSSLNFDVASGGTAVTFSAEDSDPRGMHSTGSNAERVYVPETRVYRVSVSLRYGEVAGGVRIVDVQKNGKFDSNVISLRGGMDTGNRWAASGSIDVLLQAGDFLQVNATQTSGRPLRVVHCYFSVQPM